MAIEDTIEETKVMNNEKHTLPDWEGEHSQISIQLIECDKK